MNQLVQHSTKYVWNRENSPKEQQGEEGIESIFAELGFTQLKLEIKEQEIRSRIVVARFI